MLYQYDDPMRRATTPNRGRRRWRARIWLSFVAFAAGLAAATWFFPGDTFETLTRANLNLAEERWRSAAVRDYDLQLQMNASEYAVEVRSGIVMHVRVNGLDAPSNTWRNYSVDGLFGTLGQELDNLADPTLPFAAPSAAVLARVRFHPRLGYPERYVRSGGPMGRTAFIGIMAFRPLSAPR